MGLGRALTGRLGRITNRILLINFLTLTSAWAADSYYMPASPLQPVGQSKAEPPPKADPQAPIPYVPPAAASPQPAASPKPEPELLGCAETCAKGRVENLAFDFQAGRIGIDSQLSLVDGENLEIVAYSEACPRQEGKKSLHAPDSLPDGCVFVFVIPSSRASVAPGSKHRKYAPQRCLGGKIGMSEFRCDETTLAPGSVGPTQLSREQE
jgi:hypothetical protein